MTLKLRTLFFRLTLTAMLVAGLAFSAQATLIGLTGSVNFADPVNPNPFNIVTGTVLTGTAYWDDSLLTGGEEVLEDFSVPSMSLAVNIGDFSFNTADDWFLGFTFGFIDKNLKNIGVFFGTDLFSNWGFDIVFDFPGATNVFYLFDPVVGPAVVTGTMAPVPEPTSVLLMGVGLASLGFLRARRTKKTS